MAKKSAVENNKRKMRLVKQYANRRNKLKAIANNESLTMFELSSALRRKSLFELHVLGTEHFQCANVVGDPV